MIETTRVIGWLSRGAHAATLAACALAIATGAALAQQPAKKDQKGKTPAAAAKLSSDARALEDAGAFALVLETIPAPLARMVTERLQIPTIGIGAGVDCDGQVQVFHDILGIYDDCRPLRHAKQYARLGEVIREAISQYISEVQQGEFPTEANSFDMDESTLAELAGV